MGGKSERDYRKLLPPRSYINVEDFDSPQDLAEYLQYLAKNRTAYNQYHAWRQDYAGASNNPTTPAILSLTRAWVLW